MVGYTQTLTPNMVNDVRVGKQHLTTDALNYWAINNLKTAGTDLGIPTNCISINLTVATYAYGNFGRNFRSMLYRVCFGIALAASAALGGSTPAGSPAPDFSIADQYDQQVHLSSCRGKPVLLIYGDRVGSDYMGVWRRAVKSETSAGGVTVIEAANLKAVPHFMQGYVKRKFLHTNAKGQPGLAVVLDWEGVIARSYGFKDDLTNVYLIDANGTLKFSAQGKGTPEDVRPLAEAIRALNSTAIVFDRTRKRP